LNRFFRLVIGLAVLGAVLFVVGWFDHVVLLDAEREHSLDFDALLWPRAAGFLIVAGSVLLVAVAGWRLRSLELGAVYILVGAFFAFLEVINWKLAAGINDARPVLPEPLARTISDVYFYVEGPMSGDLIVGAGALLVGLGLIGARLLRPNREEPFQLMGYRR
jgi:hypothetical protein